MATFYSGYRNVLKGRDSGDSAHPYKGVGTYSNWSLFNTSHVLDGAPNNDHVPGEGRHPHDLHTSRIFQGLEDGEQPIKNAGGGTRLDDHRYGPFLNRAAGNSLAFKASYGHAPDTPVKEGGEQYGLADWIFNGVTTKSLSGSFGHIVRDVDGTGTANSFGRFDPFDPGKNSVVPTMQDPGQLASDFDIDDNTTAHKKVLEWRGVTSAKALNV